MKNSRVTKTVVLTGFVLLLISFVAFKSGAFDGYILSSGNDSHSYFTEVLAGSEIMPLDTPAPVKADTLKNQSLNTDTLNNDTVKRSPRMAHTSKTLIIIDQSLQFKMDSVKLDSNKLAPKK